MVNLFPPTINNVPSMLQSYAALFYDEADSSLNSILEKLYKDEIFGFGESNYDTIGEIMYLFVYLMLIRYKIQEDAGNGEQGTVEEYAEEYELECIRKSFMCKGIDVTPMLRVFGLYPYDETVCLGISTMRIVEDGEDYDSTECQFVVQ